MSASPDAARNVPAAMREYRQFVVWKLEMRPGDPKPTKVPYSPLTGRRASSTDPATWGTFDDASKALASGGCKGFGFVFTPADPLIFIDLDGCRDPATGKLTPIATGYLGALKGAGVEVSQSGQGLHIVATSDKEVLNDRRHKWKGPDDRTCEFYTSARFMALGGGEWQGDPSFEVIPGVLKALIPEATSDKTPLPEHWLDEARDGYSGPSSDDELMRRMADDRRPGAMFKTSAPFADLWSANSELLVQFYPSPTDLDGFDHSAADLALMSILAFWTGCNPVRMERLFSVSKLGKRQKWMNRAAYRQRTIWKVIGNPEQKYLNRDRHNEERRKLQVQQLGGIAALPDLISVESARRDLVYIENGSAVGHLPTKRTLKLHEAQTSFAASTHQVETGKIDKEGQPVTKNVPVVFSWIADPSRITVNALTWDPAQGPIAIAVDNGRRAFNTWRGISPLPVPGNWQDWAKPFVEHVTYLVPDGVERRRFIQWLAHIFQKPAELPATAYLMIAEQTGIGRGTLAAILSRVLPGHMATNIQFAAMLKSGFNGAISGKLLATTDEIREGHSSSKYQLAETLKSTLTEEFRLVNPKFGLQTVERNCCRWLLFSNHRDALPFDTNDRRIVVIENPNHRADPAWFDHVHACLDRPEFVASVQNYLLTLDISDFRAGEHAPMNMAKTRSLHALESDADRATREFAATWPGDLATTSDLVRYIGDDAPRTRHLAHVIERAGMATGGKLRVQGSVERLLIVRGNLGSADLANVPSQTIAQRIIDARNSATRQ